MTMFRRLITALLMAALPAYGWAVLVVPPTCPAQAMPAVHAVAGGHTCCGAAVTDDSGRSGKDSPCNAGQPCGAGSLAVLPVAYAMPAPAVPTWYAAAADTSVLSPDSAGIWRPPRTP